MKINKIFFGRCPYCKNLLNDTRYYPAKLLLSGKSDLYIERNCPVCDKEILIACKVEMTFDIQEGNND